MNIGVGKFLLTLPFLLFCASCNPYTSKRIPVGNSTYVKSSNNSVAVSNAINSPETPAIIFPQDQPSFIDATSTQQEVSDTVTGKPVKIYREHHAKRPKSKAVKAVHKTKKLPKPSSPHGKVKSEDLSNAAAQENTKDNFIPLAETPAQTYTEQQQKEMIANKQSTQQAVSDRAEQLKPPQQNVSDKPDQPNVPQQTFTNQAPSNVSNNSQESANKLVAPSSFDQKNPLTNNSGPTDAQQKVQLEAQIKQPLETGLIQTPPEASAQLPPQQGSQKVVPMPQQHPAAQVMPNKQTPSSTPQQPSQNLNTPQLPSLPAGEKTQTPATQGAQGAVFSEPAGIQTAPKTPSAAASATQPSVPEKSVYDLKSRPIPQV